MTPRGRRQRLNSLQEIAEQLRLSAGDPAPDLTDSILDRVHAKREFLDRKTRNMLWVGRAAIGGSVALVVLTVALLQRWSPESLELVARPAPLSTVVESVKTEATERLGDLRLAVDNAAAKSNDRTASSGGLLSLVSIAAPAAATPHTCGFCGPIIPPAEAARASSLRAVDALSPRIALASRKISQTESSPNEPGRFAVRMRFGISGSLESSVDPVSRLTRGSVLRTISLNELAPLGAAGPADSALAPK